MREIRNILVCGAGMMGKNIAFVMTAAPEYNVALYDLYEVDVAAGIRANTAQLVEKGVMTAEEVESRLSRIEFTTDLESRLISGADLVVEAVFEDMDIKQETFA